MKLFIAATLLLSLVPEMSVNAQVVQPASFDWSVSTSCGSVGTHSDFGAPITIGLAFNCEDNRGMAEFDLAGLPGSATSAIASCDVTLIGTTGTNYYNVEAVVYEGNLATDYSDYEIAASPPVGSTIDTSSLSVGDTSSWDVTTEYNSLMLTAAPALGLRLQRDFTGQAGLFELVEWSNCILTITEGLCAGADGFCHPNNPDKVAICHKQGNKKYKTLCISPEGVEDHYNDHSDDYCGCCDPSDETSRPSYCEDRRKNLR